MKNNDMLSNNYSSQIILFESFEISSYRYLART